VEEPSSYPKIKIAEKLDKILHRKCGKCVLKINRV